MAKSLLGIKHRGTGFPTVYRVIGAGSPTMIGDTFLTQKIGSVTGGPFVVGETVSHSAGAQTAVVTQVLTGRLVLHGMSSGWAPGVGTITGGTSTATAPGAGVEGLEATGSDHAAHDRVIQIQNQLFAFHYNTVYKYSQSTGFWEENYRLTNPAAADAAAAATARTGVFQVEISGAPALVAMHYSGTNICRIKSVDNGSSWTEVQLSSSSWNTLGSLQTTIWRNVLYVAHGLSLTGHDSWDPSTDSYARVSNGALSTSMSPIFLVANNRLFQLGRDTGTANFKVTEFTAGAYSGILTTAIDVNSGTPYITKNIGFVGDDDIPHIIIRISDSGYKMYKMTFPAGVCTLTEVTGVLPAALQHSGGTSTVFDRWECYVDNETNALAGSPTRVFVWFATADTAGTSRSYYEYVNDSTPMVQLSTGVAVEIALPRSPSGGGERSWFPGELDVQFDVAPVPIIGGEKVSFIVYKQPGTSDVTGVKFRLLYGSRGEAPFSFGSLSNPVASPPGPSLAISGGNEVTGIVADGTTVYTVDWAAVSGDGLTNFSQIQIQPLVYTS